MNEKVVVREKDMSIMKTIIKEQKSRIEKLQQELQQEKEKNKKLEEVVDLMAEDLGQYGPSRYYSKIRNYLGNDSVYINTMRTIKQYYFKKVKGEKDEESKLS